MSLEGRVGELISCSELDGVYRSRRKKRIEQSIKKGYELPFIEDGWEILKENKNTFRIGKMKPFDEIFEDEVWCLFKRIGFVQLNRDRNFRIKILDSARNPGKQIDVFAMDDDTIIIIECKTADTPTSRDLQKELGEVVAIREDIRKILFNNFGREIKMEWVFATKNIIWSDPDLERAEKYNVAVLQENDIEYYDQLVTQIGFASKYQLLADIFQKKHIPGLQLDVPAIKGSMGKKSFYAFAIEPSKILKISYVCHRYRGNDERTLLTYQRMLKKKRLKEIRKYIETGGMFPNSIILNFASGKHGLNFSPITHKDKTDDGTKAVLGILSLPTQYKSAFIIDGQHRLYGFSDTKESKIATLPVIAFENLDEKTQAELFIDINSKQKRVRANLLIDLVADTKWGSDNPKEKLQALTSKIFSRLSNKIGSPIHGKISASEKKSSTESPLTITSMTSALSKTNLIGKIKNDKYSPGSFTRHNEDFTLDMEGTLKRSYNIISGYLSLFKDSFPDQWDLGSEPPGYLCTNRGMTSLIFVLKEIIMHIDKKAIEENTLLIMDMNDNNIVIQITKYIQPVIDFFLHADIDTFDYYRKMYGHAGHRSASLLMMEQINMKYPEFQNTDLKAFLDDRIAKTDENAKLITPKVQLKIRDVVLTKLKEEFGEDEKGWWFEGVPLTVRKKIADRMEEDIDISSREEGFDLLDYKKIVLKNWTLFKDDLARGKGNKELKVAWMDDLNKIRKKTAHVERGFVTLDEMRLLENLDSWITDILENQSIASETSDTDE